MTPDRIRQLSPGFVVALTTLLFVGCSSGGGGSSTPQATVQGAVVDGYVRGATVTLYGTEGFAGPAALDTATTDANGDFVLTLPAAELPDYFALLSKGGTIIDTGMPAPTMAMMALRERDRYYVTPLTDRVTRQGLRAANTFVTAEQALAAELGLTPAELYDDPLAADAPAGLTAGLYRSLAAGDQTVALPDGEYLLRLVFFDKNDIGNATFTDIDALLSAKMLDGTLNIANGVVTGTIDTDTVTGHIQGPSVVLSLEYPDGSGVVRVAGTVGLLGSLSGTYVDFDDSLPDDQKLSSGIFVASLVPVSGIDSEGLKTVTEALYAGQRNLLFRDIYGDRDLGWGAMGAVSLDADAGTITAPEFDVTLNAAASVSDTLSFAEGKLVTLDDGTPAGLAVMRFTDSGGDYAYVVQALGNRRGVYVAGATVGGPYAIGESYLARSDALGVDLLTANEGESMQLAVSNVNVHMLGVARNPAEFVDTGVTFTVPSLSLGSGADGNAATVGVQVVSGSMLGLKSSAGGIDANAIDDDEDFLAIAEMHPTGALQGDIMDGGDFAGLGSVIDAADWPVPLVGFAAPASADPSLVDTGEAQLDFIARPLYTIDLENDELIALDDYKLAIISGTIRSQDNSATLSYRDNEGETGTLALTVENRGGVYHLHGPMGDEYIDILWGAGGTRAVFVSSTQADGNGTIYEIGEAFLSY
jgi:hypothetical protein